MAFPLRECGSFVGLKTEVCLIRHSSSEIISNSPSLSRVAPPKHTRTAPSCFPPSLFLSLLPSRASYNVTFICSIHLGPHLFGVSSPCSNSASCTDKAADQNDQSSRETKRGRPQRSDINSDEQRIQSRREGQRRDACCRDVGYRFMRFWHASISVRYTCILHPRHTLQ